MAKRNDPLTLNQIQNRLLALALNFRPKSSKVAKELDTLYLALALITGVV